MFCKCFSAAVSGINGILVTVEVDIRNGLPCFQMVGGIAGNVKEAKDRVKIALENSGFLLPPKHITVNMSPAEVKKEGTSFDLPVATALLAAFGYIPEKYLNRYLIVGELSLDGKVNKTNSLLPMIFVAKEKGLKIICSEENLKDIGWSDGVLMRGIRDVEELADILSDSDAERDFSPISDRTPYFDCSDLQHPFRGIYADKSIRRALILAACGGHNIFMAGNSEKEKKKLASAFVKLLPKPDNGELIEMLKMNSVLGYDYSEILKRKCVYLNAAIQPETKDFYSAHMGVIFVENINFSKAPFVSEFGDFFRRSPSSADNSKRLPCSFNFIASGTLCQCGFFPDREKCTCTLKQIAKLTSLTEGFFSEETDVFVHVPEPGFRRMGVCEEEEKDLDIKILRAREKQYKRFGGEKRLNASMTDEETEEFCRLSHVCEREAAALLTDSFTVSDYLKLLRTARTAADYEGREDIAPEDLREAYFLTKRGRCSEQKNNLPLA